MSEINNYPDFKKFEKILLRNIYNNHPDWKENVFMVNYNVEMFPQTWASTAGGFEEPGMLAGQAMTTDYTTVMSADIWLKDDPDSHVVYGVFFGNKPAYMVENPTDVFFEDFRNKNMKSRYKAKEAY